MILPSSRRQESRYFPYAVACLNNFAMSDPTFMWSNHYSLMTSKIEIKGPWPTTTYYLVRQKDLMIWQWFLINWKKLFFMVNLGSVSELSKLIWLRWTLLMALISDFSDCMSKYMVSKVISKSLISPIQLVSLFTYYFQGFQRLVHRCNKDRTLLIASLPHWTDHLIFWIRF